MMNMSRLLGNESFMMDRPGFGGYAVAGGPPGGRRSRFRGWLGE